MQTNFTTVRDCLRCISKLARDYPVDVETMDSIARSAHEALCELEHVEQITLDNVLDFRLRESTAECSQMFRAIVDASNN